MTREWSNLPRDLLSLIANGLGLIDFLSFRGVCKDWRVAVAVDSSKISPQNESLRYGPPWFLAYEGEEGSLCSLLSNEDKLYTMSIPELNGATCLASYEGWLLIFRDDGSLFFFCPFSKAKIELPSCPLTQVTDHVTAAFSSVPTSQDCIVVVANHCRKCELELFLICRGQQLWSPHSFYDPNEFKTVRTAFFDRKKSEFQFLDGDNVMLIFNNASKTKYLNKCHYRLVSRSSTKSSDKLSTLQYYISPTSPFQLISKKKEEEFIEANVSISTCGTVIPVAIGNIDHDYVFLSESIDAAEGSKSRHLKGVWIQPRYVYVPPGQTW